MAHGARAGEIRLVSVTHHHPGASSAALDDVSLQVPAGETLAVVGPEGSGKSTLLALVAGSERPVAGLVLLDGEDAAQLSPRRRGVAVVSRSYGLFPFLDVAANVAFGLRARESGPGGRALGTPASSPATVSRRVREALELVGMGEYARRRPPQLSPAHQQRVAIARALVRRPRVLLLDDPLGAVEDAAVRVRLGEDLRALQRQIAITMVYATRSGDEASAVSDRVVVLAGGRVLLEARPAEDATVHAEVAPGGEPAGQAAPDEDPAGAPAA